MPSKMNSRRKFLGLILVSALVLGWGGLLSSGFLTEDKENFRFVFATDIHLQPEMRAVEGFKQAISHIKNLMPKPMFIITGGDLVVSADAKNYERADKLYNLYKKAIEEFGMPVYDAIGNNDVFGWSKNSTVDPSHPEYGKEMFKKRLGKGNTYRSFDYGNWHFILLDSIEKDGEGGTFGYIDEKQFNWLKEDLERTGKKRPICIALHIPLVSLFTQIYIHTLAAPDKSIYVNNGTEVIKLLSSYNVKLILQGHLHILEEYRYKGTTYLTGGAVCGRWWKGSYRGHPEGFVIVDVVGDEFTWQFETYGWVANTKD